VSPGDITDPDVVRAAGAVPWRFCADGPADGAVDGPADGAAGLEVALVHRPRYDDWSWPKGKLEPGEAWAAAAVREVLEEVGARVSLGVPLPDAGYQVGVEGGARPKVVRYWAARVDRPNGEPEKHPETSAEVDTEVDAVRWLPPSAARRRLDYRRDRDQLDRLVAIARSDRLDTWPLVIVRHATAIPRKAWSGDDLARPLDEAGHRRAAELVPILAAYGVRRVLTSDALRCVATLAPFAERLGRRSGYRSGLAEEGPGATPDRARRVLARAVARGRPVALCTHRPVLPGLLGWLAGRTTRIEDAHALRESTGPGLVKGELLVAHLHGVGDLAQVVAVERHGRR
jgi:8-oxo-(d)GTP phosphatase